MNEISYALFSTPINKKLVSQLRDQGKNIFLISPFETEKKVLNEAETTDLKNALKFDWIVFTDIFTVDYFIEFLQEHNIDILDLDSVRIFTFGESVSDKLRFSEIHSDIIATSIEAEKLSNSIMEYLGTDDFSEIRFLIVKESSKNLKLLSRIKARNGVVREISLYKIIKRYLSEIAKLKALILGGAIDEFIFSDPADLIFFQKIFEMECEVSGFPEMKFSAINEVMYQMLFENGLKPTFYRQNKRG